MKLIDKDAVVAEIERRITFFSDINNKQVIDSNLDCAIAFAGLRDFLDTPEVKEVDLEKEYVSKNDLIEKAVDYIANNMQCNGYTLQTKVKFIRDFKKYMEG